MVYEIVGASALIAIGILTIYYSAEEVIPHSRMAFFLLLGFACIFAGAWIIITRVGIMTIMIKIAGLIMALIGFFLTVQFPDVAGEYQQEYMSKSGVLIGLFLLIIGAYLLFFY